MIPVVLAVSLLVLFGLLGWGLWAAVMDAYRQARAVSDGPTASLRRPAARTIRTERTVAVPMSRMAIIPGDDLIAGAHALDETEQRRFDAIVSQLSQ